MSESSPRSFIHQHPMLVGLRITLGAVFLGPWVLSLLMVSALNFQITPQQFLKEFLISQVHFLFYGALLFGAICYMRMRTNTPLAMKALAFVVICLCASAASLWVCDLAGLHTANDFTMGLAHSLGISVVVSGVVLLIEWTYHRLVVARRESERKELERERALRLAAEARWSSLESRMRPHFLFNTLSSIRELMHRDIPMADRMVERFAELVRFSLDAADCAEAPLEEELEMVSNYLAIEEMRFGHRIRWSVECPPVLASALVPPLSILTLAENAVKHAVSKRRSGGQIHVLAQQDGDHLRVTVRDDGPGFGEDDLKPGHGLDLLRQRLHLLYGSASRLTIHAEAGASSGSRVVLSLPHPNPHTRKEADEPASLLRRG